MKERPRFRNGRTYTPEKTLKAEQRIADRWDGPTYDKDVLLSVRLAFDEDGTTIMVVPIETVKSRLRGDLDNYIKLPLDALNGVAWADDKQVAEILAVKL